ncbi:MAG: sigma-E processing peptidase SpoIIGA [Oscillospiraceae bacterium]|nr:sigma-E processing peptidase SpoIIGA [Oscillospiraceae bacterium]
MKTVYADEMFLLNLIINYFIILATAKLCALPLKRLRFAFSASVGAAYSVSLLFSAFQFLASPILKLALGFLMTVVAFGVEKNLIKPFLAFMAVSAAFGGAVYAASLLAGQDLGDGLYINASMRVLALSFAACYFVLTIVFKRFARRRGRELRNVKVTLCGRTAEFKALRDTGNELYDPLSGLPVMVIGINEAGKLLPEPLLNALKTGVPEFIQALGAEDVLCSRFRLVPYSSVGVKIALLPVFRPDSLLIDGVDEKNALVGFCPIILCGNSEYSAVI